MITTYEELDDLPCFSIVMFASRHGGGLIEVAIKNWDGRWETTFPAEDGEEPWSGDRDWASLTMLDRFHEFKLLRRGLE